MASPRSSPLQRYARVLALFWGTSLAADLEYRLNFVVATLGSLGGLAGSLFSLFLFYQHGYQFQGWSWRSALVVVGLFTTLEGISQTLLVPNLNRIVTQVQEGTLDFVLLKPISARFWLSARSFSPWGVPDILLSLGLLGYAGNGLGIAPHAMVLGTVALLLGLVSLYSVWFTLGATSIWFVKIYNVTEVLRGLLEAGRFPLAAYPPVYRFVLTFVVPVAFLTTVPAETLLGRQSGTWLLASLGLAILLLAASQAVWRYALRFYTSASS
ncbi:MAG: ABC-2 family transporter protein [Gloeomargaritaceae cyanobacterium C42_A2020_066]|nr:ABC-2 family transporter protein [Gloeomargaritaceae cyanobacterium C42_A2020_066]